jgi:hypothetical protein
LIDLGKWSYKISISAEGKLHINSSQKRKNGHSKVLYLKAPPISQAFYDLGFNPEIPWESDVDAVCDTTMAKDLSDHAEAIKKRWEASCALACETADLAHVHCVQVDFE